ncbi:hypothetical protein D3C73_1431350 [compost metagenome]
MPALLASRLMRWLINCAWGSITQFLLMPMGNPPSTDKVTARPSVACRSPWLLRL